MVWKIYNLKEIAEKDKHKILNTVCETSIACYTTLMHKRLALKIALLLTTLLLTLPLAVISLTSCRSAPVTLINSAEDFSDIRYNLGGNFELRANIIVPVYSPIGTTNTPFRGTFSVPLDQFGNPRHTITWAQNELYSYGSNAYAALFGASTGIIRNLIVTQVIWLSALEHNASVKNVFIGGIVGNNRGLIVNSRVISCQIRVSIGKGATIHAGGIAGKSYGFNAHIENSRAQSGSIIVAAEGRALRANVGGLVGSMQNGALVYNSSSGINSAATTQSYADLHIGSLVGHIAGRGYVYKGLSEAIVEAYNLNGFSSIYAGGIVGSIVGYRAHIINSYSLNQITATTTGNASVGGLVGAVYLKGGGDFLARYTFTRRGVAINSFTSAFGTRRYVAGLIASVHLNTLENGRFLIQNSFNYKNVLADTRNTGYAACIIARVERACCAPQLINVYNRADASIMAQSTHPSAITGQSIPASTIHTLEWQRDTLRFNESTWILENGRLPMLR